jgi:hypothetical protein
MKKYFEKGDLLELTLTNEHFKNAGSYIGVCPLTLAIRDLFPEPEYRVAVGASWVEIIQKRKEEAQVFQIITSYLPNEIDDMIKQSKAGTWNVVYKTTLQKVRDIDPKDLIDELESLKQFKP